MTDRLLVLSGLVVLALLWLGPLPRLAADRFSAHMAMHMGVVAVAAPLLALGTRRVTVRGGDGLLAGAIGASVVELVVVWGWHTPVLHHAARTSAAGLVAEQSTFLASAFVVWWLACGERLTAQEQCRAPRSPAGASLGRAGAGVAALLLTSMHMTLLGALIALAPRPLYTHLAPTTPLDDQHLGGAIMLIVGGIVYLAGGVAVAARLVKEPRASTAAGRHP